MPVVLAPLDWVCVAVLFVSLLVGAWRGLVVEVLSVVSWLAAFVLAQWFAPDVAAKLPMAGAAEPVRYAAGFVLVFVASVFAAGLISALLRKLISAIGLRPVDRLLGAGFGLFRGVILLLALTAAITMTQFKNSAWWKESMGVGIALAALQNVKPLLPEDVGKYLP